MKNSNRVVSSSKRQPKVRCLSLELCYSQVLLLLCKQQRKLLWVVTDHVLAHVKAYAQDPAVEDVTHLVTTGVIQVVRPDVRALAAV